MWEVTGRTGLPDLIDLAKCLGLEFRCITPPDGFLLALSEMSSNTSVKQFTRLIVCPPILGGVTLTAAIIDKHLLRWVHLGETRLYLFRDGIFSQLNRDDTAAEELIEAGRLSKEEAQDHPARHLLFECLGCGDCEPASGELQLADGDLIMICSDGLYGEITEKQTTVTILKADCLQTAAENLLDGALQAGGRDNISVVLVQI